MVRKQAAEVIRILQKIEGVYTLELKTVGRPFVYLPGQFLHLAIDAYDPSSNWPESRCFSMQSSPNQTTILITYTVTGTFTKRMAEELKVGSQVMLKLPYGELFQNEHNKQKAVFIAGGTGITPFLSLFTHESFQEYVAPQIYLGFRSKLFNIYQDALNNLNNKNAAIKFVYQDTDGVLNIEKIFQENGMDASYFISGPQLMIKLFKQSLVKFGVPEKNVLTDDWE